MEWESRRPAGHPDYLTLEIEFGLGDILDHYRSFQSTFFDRCRTYAARVSAEHYTEVEMAALTLEFELAATIRAIAERQDDPVARLRMAHGFIIADDRIRTALFQELLPESRFLAYGDSPVAILTNRNIPLALQRASEADLLAHLSASAIGFLRSDTEAFGEAA